MELMKTETNHFNGIINAMLRCKLYVASVVMMMSLTACSDDDEPAADPSPKQNEAKMVLDKDKLAMIYSLRDLEGNKGRIYEMDYTVDYKLDEALDFGIDGTDRLKMFVALNLMDTIISTKSMNISYDAGCSAFACPDKTSGDYIMGRNFDFNHKDKNSNRIMIPVIAVHTAPAGGKKSVSFVDGQFVDYKSGFYTDGESDLSMLMALPYLLLDGINEDGFAVSVLKLDGNPTQQQETGKKKIFTTIAMRMLLDRASTVKQAYAMLKEFNMCMDRDSASYHFFMADATGDYAIVEYTNNNLKDYPRDMEVLTGNDTLRCVTNFYVSPTMGETEHGMKFSDHGMDRYLDLRKGLLEHNYVMTPEEGMSLLKQVAQGPESQRSTGFTQWSEIFNLTKKKVTMSILREWDKKFSFEVR